MGNTFQNWLYGWKLGRFRSRIEGLLVHSVSNRVGWRRRLLLDVSARLTVQWRAREIHPWDLDLPLEKRESVFAEQSLFDTDAAIGRIFKALPHVDVIDLSVLAPCSETVIMAGTIERGSLPGAQRLASVRMRLLELGVRYRLNGSRLEALGETKGGGPRKNPPTAGATCADRSAEQYSLARP